MIDIEKQNNRKSLNSSFSVIGPLRKSKFPIYLAKLKKEENFIVIKLFPNEKGNVSPSFLREGRAFSFSHPNLIEIIDYNSKVETTKRGESCGFNSLIFSEYAPFGDLADLLKTHPDMYKDQVLIRSFFHYLCEGVSFLQSKQICHCDLKNDNILIGKDYIPKICDFDTMISVANKEKLLTSGTVNYRAPELITNIVSDPYKLDVYSLGIILLCLQFGEYPYAENSLFRGYDLQKLLQESDPEFWSAHKSAYKISSDEEENFKNMIFGMTKKRASQRWNLKDVMNCEWYKGPTYSDMEFSSNMGRYFSKK